MSHPDIDPATKAAVLLVVKKLRDLMDSSEPDKFVAWGSWEVGGCGCPMGTLFCTSEFNSKAAAHELELQSGCQLRVADTLLAYFSHEYDHKMRAAKECKLQGITTLQEAKPAIEKGIDMLRRMFMLWDELPPAPEIEMAIDA